MSIGPAVINDIPELVNLINSAYRGNISKKGWTTEADLIEGSLRTDEASLHELMRKPGAIILKYCDKAGNISGCVYLQNRETKLYLGMLTVSPLTQAQGIGKQLLTAAKEYAEQLECYSIFMNVISLRHELISWYEQHGYQRTGETKPFPSNTKFGIPKQPLEFLVLENKLS